MPRKQPPPGSVDWLSMEKELRHLLRDTSDDTDAYLIRILLDEIIAKYTERGNEIKKTDKEYAELTKLYPTYMRWPNEPETDVSFGHTIIVRHLFESKQIKPGSRWLSASGAIATVIKVDTKKHMVTYSTPYQDVLYKDSATFQTRYCLIVE